MHTPLLLMPVHLFLNIINQRWTKSRYDLYHNGIYLDTDQYL